MVVNGAVLSMSMATGWSDTSQGWTWGCERGLEWGSVGASAQLRRCGALGQVRGRAFASRGARADRWAHCMLTPGCSLVQWTAWVGGLDGGFAWRGGSGSCALLDDDVGRPEIFSRANGCDCRFDDDGEEECLEHKSAGHVVSRECDLQHDVMTQHSPGCRTRWGLGW